MNSFDCQNWHERVQASSRPAKKGATTEISGTLPCACIGTNISPSAFGVSFTGHNRLEAARRSRHGDGAGQGSAARDQDRQRLSRLRPADLRSPIRSILGPSGNSCCARSAPCQSRCSNIAHDSLGTRDSSYRGEHLASELDVKRLEILHEFVPQARRIAALADPTTISTRAQLASGARDLGLELVQFEAQSPDEIGRALDAIAIAKVEAVNVLASPILNAARRLIIDRMFRRLPNCGEADQDSCDAALREIIPRLQSTFDVAPDD